MNSSHSRYSARQKEGRSASRNAVGVLTTTTVTLTFFYFLSSCFVTIGAFQGGHSNNAEVSIRSLSRLEWLRAREPQFFSISTTKLFASLQAPPKTTGSKNNPSFESTNNPDDDSAFETSRPNNNLIDQNKYTPLSQRNAPSHILTHTQISPIFTFTKNKNDSTKEPSTKLLNLTGLYHLLIIATTLPFWVLAMHITRFLGDTFPEFDPNRAKFDYTGKIWCRIYLSLTDCYPEIEGDLSRLKEDRGDGTGNGACLFVANHSSFLDIAVLCCVLDPVFKFIAKDSLKAFPGVGLQLVGGEHVLIDRTDKRSQLRTFKQGITYLQSGIPIMAFPEGRRSPDGRLMDFKGGLFSMAVKAKVPIVPLSIANTHAVMPGIGFLPVQSGKGKLRVFVHEPIKVEGKNEEEMVKLVREALLRELPLDQHPFAGLEGEVAVNDGDDDE